MGQLNSRGTRSSATTADGSGAAEPVCSVSENPEALAPTFVTVIGQQGRSRRHSVARLFHSVSGRNSREGGHSTLVENRRWWRHRSSRALHSHQNKSQDVPRVDSEPIRNRNDAPEAEASNNLLESHSGCHTVTQPPLTDNVNMTRHEQLASGTARRTLDGQQTSPTTLSTFPGSSSGKPSHEGSYVGEHAEHAVQQNPLDNMPSASSSNYRSPAVIHPQTVSNEDATVNATPRVFDQAARQIATNNDLLRPTGTLFVLQGSVPIVVNPMPIRNVLPPTARTVSPNPSPTPTFNLRHNSQTPSGSRRNSMFARLLQHRDQGTSLASNTIAESSFNERAGHRNYSRGAAVLPENTFANTSSSDSVEPTPTAATTMDDSVTREGSHQQSTLSLNDPLGAFLSTIISVAAISTAVELLSSQTGPSPTQAVEIDASARARTSPFEVGSRAQPVRDNANNGTSLVNLSDNQETLSQRRLPLDSFPPQGFEEFLTDLRSDMRMAVSHTGPPLDGRFTRQIDDVRGESIGQAFESADTGRSDISAVSAFRTFGGMPTDDGFDLWRMHLFPPTTAGLEAPANMSLQPNASMVPAIVVGLRAINSDPTSFLSSQPGDDTQFNADTNTDILETTNFVDGTHEFTTHQNPRAPFHSRAAHYSTRLRREQDLEVEERYSTPNVINNLRTFVIIVFGAYYPRDHHIFSRPETLDSFDALRELASLSSQNKVPVVTEEEIEHSGLEVLKAVSVGEFESDGRIASNCMERCLICLDDYEPEDELRLLSCKHAFHRACVDRWLKTGQNNCPACRNKGVET